MSKAPYLITGTGIPLMMALINVPFFPNTFNIISAALCAAIGIGFFIWLVFIED